MRFSPPSRRFHKDSQQVVGCGVAGLKLNGCLNLRRRLAKLALFCKSHAVVEMAERVAGRNRTAAVKMPDRRRVVLRRQQIRQARAGIRRAGIDLKSFSEIFWGVRANRLLPPGPYRGRSTLRPDPDRGRWFWSERRHRILRAQVRTRLGRRSGRRQHRQVAY